MTGNRDLMTRGLLAVPTTTDYRSPRLRANLTMLMLCVMALLVAVIIVMKFNQSSLLSSMTTSDVINRQAIQSSLRTHEFLEVAYLVNFMVVAVAFLMWMHRASSNLQPLGVMRQRFTPWAGVIWWFVPFAFLWMPYLALREVWHGSRITAVRTHPAFNLWWWMWLVCIFPGPALPIPPPWMDAPDPYTDPKSYIDGNSGQILFLLLLVVASVFLFEIVRRTTKNQEQKFELATQHPDLYEMSTTSSVVSEPGHFSGRLGSLSSLYLMFEGRINRRTYFVTSMLAWLGAILGLFLPFIGLFMVIDLGAEGLVLGLATIPAMIGFFVMLTVAFWVPIALAVKRLHDTGRSGAYLLLYLIPLIGGIWLLILLLLGGTEGQNKYGPQPPPKIRWTSFTHPHSTTNEA